MEVKEMIIFPVNHMDMTLEIALSKEVMAESPKPRRKKEAGKGATAK